MFKVVLQFFRPSVALTALILLGGWQGYVLVRSIPERLPFSHPAVVANGAADREDDVAEDAAPAAPAAREPANRLLAGIERRSGLGRSLLWILLYTLLCFGGVPVIRRALDAESNAANAAILICFSLTGILLAALLAGFHFSLFRTLLLTGAAAYAVGLIFMLAGELENMRA